MFITRTRTFLFYIPKKSAWATLTKWRLRNTGPNIIINVIFLEPMLSDLWNLISKKTVGPLLGDLILISVPLDVSTTYII